MAGESEFGPETGHIAAAAEIGWRSTVATIRMQLQVFARVL